MRRPAPITADQGWPRPIGYRREISLPAASNSTLVSGKPKESLPGTRVSGRAGRRRESRFCRVAALRFRSSVPAPCPVHVSAPRIEARQGQDANQPAGGGLVYESPARRPACAGGLRRLLQPSKGGHGRSAVSKTLPEQFSL